MGKIWLIATLYYDNSTTRVPKIWTLVFSAGFLGFELGTSYFAPAWGLVVFCYVCAFWAQR